MPRLATTEDALSVIEQLIVDEPELDAYVVLLAGPGHERVAIVIDDLPRGRGEFGAFTRFLKEICAQMIPERIAIGRVAPLPVLDLVSSAAQRRGWAKVIAAIDATGTPLIDLVAVGIDAAWSLRRAADEATLYGD